jgi:hypothetical protein
MGALKDVGFVGSNGSISDSQRLNIVNEITDAIRTAPKITLIGAELSLINSAVPLAAESFSPNKGLEEHKSRLPQWHAINIDTFLNSVVNMFDAVPTTGVGAKVIPIIDPTQPIIDVLNILKDLLPDLIDFDIIEFLTSIITPLFLKIPAFLADLASLAQEFLSGSRDAINSALEKFVAFIKANVIEKINKSRSQIDRIKEEFDRRLREVESFKNKLIDAIRNIIESIVSFPSFPSLNIQIPNFNFNISIPNITLPSLPSLPIFHISPPFPPGIAYFFLEFIKKLIAGIATILSNVSRLISAIIQGITSFISYIVQSIFDLIKSIINTLVPNIDSAVTLAATMLVFAKKITQMAVVSILGWIVGPGIIINIAAREVGLVE